MAEAFTASSKLACVERELRYRRRVYERRVADGKMTPNAARQEIAVMESIAEDYRALAQKERLL